MNNSIIDKTSDNDSTASPTDGSSNDEFVIEEHSVEESYTNYLRPIEIGH